MECALSLTDEEILLRRKFIRREKNRLIKEKENKEKRSYVRGPYKTKYSEEKKKYGLGM